MNQNDVFYSFKWLISKPGEILCLILDRIAIMIAIEKMIGDPEIQDRDHFFDRSPISIREKKKIMFIIILISP